MHHRNWWSQKDFKFDVQVERTSHSLRTTNRSPIGAWSGHVTHKKVKLTLIGSRQRAFQRAIDEQCTLPLSPQKGDTKCDLLFFPVKFNYCRKKSATKFLCLKTSSGKVVATSYLYLTVHRWIASDVPIDLKFALEVTHPFRKRRFLQISLNSTSVVRKEFNHT